MQPEHHPDSPGDPDGDPQGDAPDHRRLGRQLGYYSTDDRCGSGLPLWLPAGAAVRQELERYVVDLERRYGYQHVYTPELGKRQLYEQSGHWGHYHDDMYPPMQLDAEEVALRPMNCPHHILVYQAQRRSRRELPLRIAELGTMFRYERSGVVGGLARVRQMTLNDGHVFCLPDDAEAELSDILDMVDEAYRALAIPPPRFRLSRRGEGDKYVDDGDMWARGEAILRSLLVDRGVPFTEAEGEAAFYGPKIDLQKLDPQGREETLSTIQIDFYLPDRFELWAHHGDERQRPIMLHRSIVSSMERMVAHLLEVHDGALPPWLAPVQVRVLPVTDDRYVDRVLRELAGAGLRVDADRREETLGARIRHAQGEKVPYVVVVGQREAEAGTVAVRLADGRQLDPLPVAEAASAIAAVSEGRQHAPWPPESGSRVEPHRRHNQGAQS